VHEVRKAWFVESEFLNRV